MPPKSLIADVILGQDITHSLVLASHPDERKDADGRRPSLTRRTIAMRFDGIRFSDAMSLPFPVHRGWCSDNGTGYCAPIKGTDVYIYANGDWRREQFSGAEANVLRMWGLSGSSQSEDFVYISSDGALFVRHQDSWNRHTVPVPVRRLFGIHGRAHDELYACSDAGLLIWTGVAFEESADQPRPLVKEVLVSGEEIFAGNKYLMHWTKDTHWQRCEPTVPDVTALLELDNTIIVGTFEKGVMEGREAFAPRTPPFMCLQMQQIGAGAFAMGDDHGYVKIGAGWRRLTMPLCEVNLLPSI